MPALNQKTITRIVVLGILVAAIMPLLAGFMPAIIALPVVGVTLGEAISAGLAVVIGEWVLNMAGIKV